MLLLLSVTGCTHAISESGRKLADPGITYGKLRLNPDSYIGKHVILGGKIAAVRNAQDGATLEVVQMDLDCSLYPQDIMVTGGRFLATSPGILDRMIYAPGRLVTILGEIKGEKTGMMDEVEYSYPVVAIREIHVWRGSGLDQVYSAPSPYNYGYDTGPAPFRPSGQPMFK